MCLTLSLSLLGQRKTSEGTRFLSEETTDIILVTFVTTQKQFFPQIRSQTGAW